MVKDPNKNKKKTAGRDLIKLGFSLLVLFLLNYVGSFVFHRFDLTSEKRYTLSPQSKNIAQNIDGTAFFKVYLEGSNLPAGFIRLRDETKEMLDEFRAYSGGKIQYEFVDPSANPDSKQRMAFYEQLYREGLLPINLKVQQSSGNSELMVVPGAILTYRGREIAMNLYQDQGNPNTLAAINYSIEELEYQIDNAIHKLTIDIKPTIAFIQGHGELDSVHVAGAIKTLGEYYNIRNLTINHRSGALIDSLGNPRYKAIIIAKPDTVFTDPDKISIDQYVMHSGKVFWLVSPVFAPMDSLAKNGLTIGFKNDMNLDDMMFQYGVRLNGNIVMDFQCSGVPINTALRGEQAHWEMVPWFYEPLISPTGNCPIVKNLNLVEMNVASTIDTIKVPGIKKTILLTTSKNTKLQNGSFARISFQMAIKIAHLAQSDKDQLEEAQFKSPFQPVAVLLEGKFPSLYRNRIPFPYNTPKYNFLSESKPTAMIVVSDGDVIRNETESGGRSALPLGVDFYTRQMYSNNDFVLNCMNYLCGDSTLLNVRGRQLQIRLLDDKKAKTDKTEWQIINLVVPVLLIIFLGLIFAAVRRAKYAK